MGRAAAGGLRSRRAGLRRGDVRTRGLGVDVYGQRPGHPARHQRRQVLDQTQRHVIRALRRAVDWNGKPAEFVVGIAGAGKDHMALLTKIAGVFLNKDEVARLRGRGLRRGARGARQHRQVRMSVVDSETRQSRIVEFVILYDFCLQYLELAVEISSLITCFFEVEDNPNLVVFNDRTFFRQLFPFVF